MFYSQIVYSPAPNTKVGIYRVKTIKMAFKKCITCQPLIMREWGVVKFDSRTFSPLDYLGVEDLLPVKKMDWRCPLSLS